MSDDDTSDHDTSDHDTSDHDTSDHDEVHARVLLSRAGEPGDLTLGRWVAEVGATEAAARILAGSCPLRRADAYQARAVRADTSADLDAARAAGAVPVLPGTTGWPTQLDDLGPGRPHLLWVRGGIDLRLAALCSVAVVGARAATPYGERVAVELAADLAGAGWTVVSGGAYGIDAAAHRGALAVDGATVAVLANGADVVYPRGNDALLARVVDHGAVVTELAPGAHPTRSRFLERNRVIAALSRGTVVVEAAGRSGALGTAARAVALNRPVMAVPGPVTSPVSAGAHRLLRDQEAVLVRHAADVLELLGTVGAASEPPTSAVDPAGEVRPTDALDADLRAVHDALARRTPRTVDEIALRAGLPERVALGLLGELGLRGLADRVEGGWAAVSAGEGRVPGPEPRRA